MKMSIDRYCPGNIRGGQALIVSLIALAVLVAFGGSASLILLAESRYLQAEQNKVAAYYIAISGLEVGRELIRADNSGVDTLADNWVREGRSLRGELGNGFFGLGLSAPGEGGFMPGIVDMESKINVNVASPDVLKSLAPALTDDVVRTLVMRRRRRRFVSMQDVESTLGGYGSILDSVLPDSSIRLRDIITVYGNGKINVNTAPLPVLASLKGVTIEAAERLIAHRTGEDGLESTGDDGYFSDVEDALDVLSLEEDRRGEVRQWLTVRSRFFGISSWGRAKGRWNPHKALYQVVERDDSGLRVVCFSDVSHIGLPSDVRR